MNMNTSEYFFSFSRFVKVLRKDLMEVWKKHVLRFAVLYGLLTISFLWSFYLINVSLPHRGYVAEMNIFVCSFLLTGCYSASLMAEYLKEKTSRFSALMLPATQFEKYLSRWLIFIIGFIAFYFLAFFLADLTRYVLSYLFWPNMEETALLPFLDYLIGDNTGLFEECFYLFVGVTFYFFFQSVFVLGSFVWPRNAFLKTFVALLGLVVVILFLLIFVGDKLLYHHIYIPDNAIVWSEKEVLMFVCLLTWLLTFVNWVLAYYRFRELETINRW